MARKRARVLWGFIMADKSQFSIGLWGMPRTGKTTFLAMLYHSFLEDSNYYAIHEADEPSRLFVKEMRERLYVDRQFPIKTPHVATYQYDVVRKGQTSEDDLIFTLSFRDAPGELYQYYYDDKRRHDTIDVEQPSTEPQQAPYTPSRMFGEIKDSDALVLLLDPSWADPVAKNRDYDQLLFHLLQALRAERSNPNPPVIALCLVKADGRQDYWEQRYLWPEDCYRAGVEMPDCRLNCPVYEILGRAFMEKHLPGLTIPGSQIGCFVTSAIGRTRDGQLNVGTDNGWRRAPTPTPHSPISASGGQLEPLANALREQFDTDQTPTFYPSTIKNKNEINPVSLIEPVEWLLMKLQQLHGAE